jgi:signal transduction histidine kinase
MLNLGRVDADQYRAVSIKKVIEDVLVPFDLQLKERNIKIELARNGAIPLIRADPRSLKEAFSNILINSIQAMSAGGKIDISTRKKKDRNTGKTLLEVSITDEGGGIPRSNLRRIFDPFFTTKQQGSGLGLYVCYQIIKTHRGEINVRNTGSGANFTILLPIPENETSFVEEKRTVHG